MRPFREGFARGALVVGLWQGTVSVINISRSPLRISFFGGGTDYPMYFHDYPGAVLGASIDKYIYTIALPMADFAEHRYRITYRIVEGVDRVEDIKHNVIRATLLDMRYDEPLNVAIISDLPGNSGLGSSSSFTVGFIALMEHLRGRSITKFDLFKRAVHTESDLLKENVGIQDQIHAAFGGLNLYQFHKDEFTIRPAQMATECRDALDRSLCLVYTGIQRHASAMVQEQLKNTEEKRITRICPVWSSSVIRGSGVAGGHATRRPCSRDLGEARQRGMGGKAQIVDLRLLAQNRRSL